MSDGIQLYFDNDGKAKIYDDTYDIAIHCETEEEYDKAMQMLKRAKEMQWIPCSERLPEEDHWLGGSGKQFSENVLVSVLNSADEDEWVDVSHTIDGEWTLELPSYCKIIAWMPLPPIYRGNENDE